MSEDIAGKWCCYAAMPAKVVIDRAVAVIAYQQEARNGLGRCQARRSSDAARGDDLGDISYRVGRNGKSARTVEGESRSLSIDTKSSLKAAIRSVERHNAADAD